MSAACCGFEHRTLFTNIELELYQVIEKLITENGVDIFYTGGMGQFDEQFTNAVRKAKLKYNHMSIVLIKPYFSNELNTNKEYYNYRYGCGSKRHALRAWCFCGRCAVKIHTVEEAVDVVLIAHFPSPFALFQNAEYLKELK